MATLTVKQPTAAVAVALGAAAAEAGGDKFLNDGRVILYVKNTNASTYTITVVTAGVVLGSIAIADVTFTVAQSEEKIVGPFPPRYFNDGGGFVNLSYSGVTNLTVAAVKLT